MATTKIWKVTGSLPKLINYISNPSKTNGGLFVTGINCTLETATMEMEAVKTQFGKTSGITAYHAYQSFAEGEVSVITAHEIGVKLAKRTLGDRFQVLISTHTDHENHIHNHFMWNSISHTDGFRYNHDKAAYRAFRAESDHLCREHQLSIIEKPGQDKTKSYADWRADKEGKPTAKELIRTDINHAIKRSRSKEAFITNMEKMGYEIKWGKELSVKAPDHERFLRPARHFGEAYSSDKLMEQFVMNARWGISPNRRPTLSSSTIQQINIKLSEFPHQGLIRQHYHYALLVTAFSTLPIKKLYPDLRTEVMMLEIILRQTEMLITNILDTLTKILEYKIKQEQRIPPLIKERNQLYKIIAKSSDTTNIAEARRHLKDIGYELKALRTQIHDCVAIANRNNNCQERIKEFAPQMKGRAQDMSMTR